MAFTDFTIYLENEYPSMNYTNGLKAIGDVFPGATNADKVDAAAAEFPWWIAYCTCDSARAGVGAPDRVPTPGAPMWTDDQIVKCTIAVAAHNNTVWATGGAIGSDWYFGALPLSRANIIWPHGDFYINYPLMGNFGQYIFQGSNQSSPGLSVEVTLAGTAATRGYYYPAGVVNSKMSYSLGGGYLIAWSGSAWQIKNGGTIYYSSTDNVSYPWQVTTWTAVSGAGPVPTVKYALQLSQVCGGTRLSLFHEEWLDIAGADDGPIKNLVESINYPRAVGGTLYAGVLGASGGSALAILDSYYMEGTQFSHVMLDGRKSQAPEAVNGGNDYVTSYVDGGIALYRMGSNSMIAHANGNGFNNASFVLGSGVPALLFNTRSFDCNYAGWWLRGDGTFTIIHYECDECPTVFKAEGYIDPTNPSSYLLTPGCTLTALGGKVETGTSGVSSRYKYTMLFDGVGWCVFNIQGVGYASSNIFPELLCRVDPNPTGFTSTQSRGIVLGLKVFGYVRTLMHHAPTTGQAWKLFLDRNALAVKFDMTTLGFEYNSADGGSAKLIGGRGRGLLNVPYKNRQNGVSSLAGTPWNDTVNPGLPAYPYGW